MRIEAHDPAGAPATAQPAGAGAGRRLLAESLRHHRRGLVVATLGGLVWTAGKVAVPKLVQLAIDRGIEGGGNLAAWSGAILVAACVAGAFTGVRRWYAFEASRAHEAELRDRVFAHLQRLHFAFHDQAQTGQLMSRANTDLTQVQAFTVMIPITISNLAAFAGAAVVLVALDPTLALLALGPLPALNVLAKRFASRLHPVAAAIQARSADLATVVEESVSGIRVVKGFGAEAVQAGRLRAAAAGVRDRSLAAARVRAAYLPSLDLLPLAGMVAVLFVGGHRVLDGRLSVGELVAFNVYVGLLVWPLRMVGNVVAMGQRAVASCDRVAEVLGTEPEVADRPHARRLGRPRGDGPVGEVRFEGVTFTYPGSPRPVLDRFDLAVRPGESVALVGATGSGKTTVARLVPRFYDVDAGRVLLDGVDVRDLRLHELRRAVGIVFEETFLFAGTVRDNIAFADPDADESLVARAARLAGAHDFIVRLPDGYDTLIGERGFSLSGGQRQRIAIARAILADPRVLVLDDATSSVDPAKEHEIRDALAEVMRGRTTIVIAHRPATIALADRVVLIDGGGVAAQGTHAELYAGDERYRAVLAAGEMVG